jgi:PAS domain S-box-containing protein
MPLKRGDEQYRNLLTAVSAHSYTVFVEDGKDASTEHGPGCVEVTGYQPEDYERDPYLWISMIHPDDRERVLAHIGLILEGRMAPPIEHRIVTRQGATRWIRNTMAPTVGADGKVTRYDGVVEDITERREFEDQLKENARRYQALADYATDCIYWLGPDGRLRYVSPACEEVSGHAPSEFMEDPELLERIVHPEDRPVWAERHSEGYYADGAPSSRELRIIHKDGSPRWVLHICRPIRESQGELGGFRGTLHDITDRRQAQTAAIQASRMEAAATLAGGIAHDFNNMMMSVMGYCELLKMQTDDPDSLDMLKEIGQVAEKAGDLSQQMLAFARGGKFQAKPLNLNQILLQTLNARFGAGHEDRFELSLEEDLGTVQGDPTQIGQVALQIIRNAIEAVNEEGKIKIETANVDIDADFARSREGLAPGPGVRLRVEDSGCGMTEEIRSRVFEPFFTTKFQGRGMGLAAAYGIIKNHQGDISVESVPGRGSVFTVWLPAVPAVEKKVAPAVTPAIPTGKENILVVNEDETLRTVTQKLLERLGYHVWTSRNNQTAVNFVLTCGEEPHVHLVVMDAQLADISVYEALRIMKRAKPDIRILASFHSDQDEEIRAVMEAGADSCLRKPFQLDTLGRKIREMLDRKKG